MTVARHRIGLIGLGMVLPPHLQSLKDLKSRVEIAAAFTPSAERQAKVRAEHPELPLVTDLDAIFGSSDIDAVVIISPPNTHLELVERAARAGKHVLLEKPIDGTLERSERLVATMEQAGLTLGIVLQYRFRPVARIMRDAAAAPGMGRLISASAQVRWWRDDSYFNVPGRGMRAVAGGGVLLTQAIHTLDLFQYLTGPIVEVRALTATSPLRRIDTEDIACAAVRFAGGAIGTIDASTVSYPGFAERIELAYEGGTIVMSAEDVEIWRKDGSHVVHKGAPSNAGGANPMAYTHDAHKGVLTDFLDALDQGRPTRISGREALGVHRLIDAILRSSAEARPVEVKQA